MERDPSLSDFVSARLGADGVFRTDAAVMQVISRIATKTAAGLLFHEFGRVVPLADISLVAVDHFKNLRPSALAELHRRDDALWAEVTPSGRELERQVFAWDGQEPPHMPKWRIYVPEFFEYMFLRRSNNMLLTALKLHDALTVLLECPWPSRAGPRRKGRPPRGPRAGRGPSGTGKSPLLGSFTGLLPINAIGSANTLQAGPARLYPLSRKAMSPSESTITQLGTLRIH
jgi:hypothetical protein